MPGELCVARLGSGEVLGPGLMGGEHSGEMEAACHKKINVLLMKIFEQKYFLTFDLPDTLLLTPEPPHTSAEI